MNEQQAYKFIKFSDEKWHCCTPGSSVTHPSIQKLLMYEELSRKSPTVYGIKIRPEVEAYVRKELITYLFFQFKH